MSIKKYQIITVLILGGCFLVFNNCFAKIEITEIMYDLGGTLGDTDTNREWIEIHNTNSSEIDLTGWKLNDGDDATNHGLIVPPDHGGQGSMILPSGSYAVIAEHATTFLTDHSGFSGTVIDTAEIKLKDASSTVTTLKIIAPNGTTDDEITYYNSWGANGNGKTLEKNSQGQWQESAIDGGTPGAANSLQQTANSPQPTTDTAQPSTTDNSQPTTPNQPTDEPKYKQYSDKIYINEFIPNPVGSDTDNEWIELINLDSETIDLSGWQISDSATSTKPFTVPETTLIQPNELLLFTRPQTKIALNNNGDAVKLFYPNADLAQEINYTDSQEGWSVAREKDEDYAWTSQPTPKTVNIIKQEIKKVSAPLPKKSLIAPVATATGTVSQQSPDSTPSSVIVSAPDESDDNKNQMVVAANPSSLNETPTIANDQPTNSQASPDSVAGNVLAQSLADSQVSPNPEQLTASINNPVESGAKNQTFAWGKTIALATLIAGFGAIILANIRRRLH